MRSVNSPVLIFRLKALVATLSFDAIVNCSARFWNDLARKVATLQVRKEHNSVGCFFANDKIWHKNLFHKDVAATRKK